MNFPISDEHKSAVLEFGRPYWKNIDIDTLQPICHGTPRSEEELKEAGEQLKKIEEHNRAAMEMKGLTYESEILFPHLQ
jgi:hypothetical protein